MHECTQAEAALAIKYFETGATEPDNGSASA